jgi:hypothetical protein
LLVLAAKAWFRYRDLLAQSEVERLSQRSRTIAKLSTLDAAKVIYFIIVGLAIRESLALLSPFQNDPTNAGGYGLGERILVGLGFVVTALRFSHGVSILCGYEKERVEKSTIPSPTKIFLLYLFLAGLAILLFLMADNIHHARTFMVFTLLTFSLDLFYIWVSGVVRNPMRVIRRWGETAQGFLPHAALEWIVSDAVLIVVLIVLLLVVFPAASVPEWARIPFVGATLILATAFDYWANREFYFGGRDDKRKGKFVFIRSPLEAGDQSVDLPLRMKSNIRRVQWYCHQLTRADFGKRRSVIPFAAQTFYAYFLGCGDGASRVVAQACAIAYLRACDSIYIYLPCERKPFLRFFKRDVYDQSRLRSGLDQEFEEAKKLGIEVKFCPEVEVGSIPSDWRPAWNPLRYGKPLEFGVHKFDPDGLRKRVFVCSYLRGIGFDLLTDPEQRRKCLEENVRMALWYCTELVQKQPREEGKEEIAPFAPQAFYPYFWRVLEASGETGAGWKAWFERSLEIVKICDAVYFYVPSGLPDKVELSDGMSRIHSLAEGLGLEIQYKPTSRPPDDFRPTLPDFRAEALL